MKIKVVSVILAFKAPIVNLNNAAEAKASQSSSNSLPCRSSRCSYIRLLPMIMTIHRRHIYAGRTNNLSRSITPWNANPDCALDIGMIHVNVEDYAVHLEGFIYR